MASGAFSQAGAWGEDAGVPEPASLPAAVVSLEAVAELAALQLADGHTHLHLAKNELSAILAIEPLSVACRSKKGTRGYG